MTPDEITKRCAEVRAGYTISEPAGARQEAMLWREVVIDVAHHGADARKHLDAIDRELDTIPTRDL